MIILSKPKRNILIIVSKYNVPMYYYDPEAMKKILIHIIVIMESFKRKN